MYGHMRHSHAARLYIHTCHIHIYIYIHVRPMWHASFICIHIYVSRIYVTCHIHIRVTYIYIYIYMCVPCDIYIYMRPMWHTYIRVYIYTCHVHIYIYIHMRPMWHASFICDKLHSHVTWIIHICNTTPSCAQHECAHMYIRIGFMCATCLKPICLIHMNEACIYIYVYTCIYI